MMIDYKEYAKVMEEMADRIIAEMYEELAEQYENRE